MIGWLRMGAIGLACAVVAVLALARPAMAQSDVTPPVLVSLSISPTLVNTSQTSQTVTFTAHITDDLSGFRYGNVQLGPLLLQGNDQDKLVSFYDSDRVAGNTLDGIYVQTLTMPRYSADGRWKAKYMWMDDQVGNSTGCNTNGKNDCPADWGTFFFVNVRDNSFLYLSQLMKQTYQFPG